jgi:hypothetical protein
VTIWRMLLKREDNTVASLDALFASGDYPVGN